MLKLGVSIKGAIFLTIALTALLIRLLWSVYLGLLCPRQDNGLDIKCNPVAVLQFDGSVHRSVGHTKEVRSKSNGFHQSCMKLGHIVMYHNVFFKFDNCLY